MQNLKRPLSSPEHRLKKFIIIDGPAILHRAWHALPKLTDPQGKTINALYGFAMLLLKLIREFQPEYIVCAFDTHAPTFRHQLYKEYKATRTPQPQEFYEQIPRTKKLLNTFNIKSKEKGGFEADDFIAQFKETAPKNILKIIVSGDSDVFQLIDQKTLVYFLKKGIGKTQLYDEKAVKKRFDLSPKQLVDYKALKGDPSDNIPGIPGIGDKTAIQLLKKFETLENIYQHLKMPKNSWQIKASLGNLLLKHYPSVMLAKKLSILQKNPHLSVNFKECSFDKLNIQKIKKHFEKLGFKSLIPRLEELQSIRQQNKLL